MNRKKILCGTIFILILVVMRMEKNRFMVLLFTILCLIIHELGQC